MKGRRLPDTRFGDLPDDVQPGDVWKYVNGHDGGTLLASAVYPDADMSGNLTGGVWGYASPDGNGIGTLALHTVREHDDGTISVLPGDGSSNSILHTGGSKGLTWHGYIYNGEWRPV